jgi:L-2-hydroxycarboxylate dehydrogenase (NAD+)
MNRPPEEFRQIDVKQLRTLGENCLQAAGMPAADASQLAHLLTNSDLRGVRSHGTRALYGYCRTIRNKRVNPTPDTQIVRETDTSILVDGDGGLGYAPTMLVTEKAIEKAKEKGIAVGATRCIGHYGSAGHYVRRAMEQDCTAYSVQGAYPQYYTSNEGKRAAHYGNPPLCFGFPGQDEAPVILDGATCILADYQRGEEFEAIEAQIPAAFFKSIGYTAIGTLLGGAFVGQADPRAEEIAQKWPGARLGSLVVVMNLGLFAPAEQVRRGVDEMGRLAIEQMIPVAGYAEATLPGAIEYCKEQEYQRDGVPIALEDIQRLEECAAEFGVTPPWKA